MKTCDPNARILPVVAATPTTPIVPQPPIPRDPFALPYNITHEIYIATDQGWMQVSPDLVGHSFHAEGRTSSGVHLGIFTRDGTDKGFNAIRVPKGSGGLKAPECPELKNKKRL